MNNPIRTKADIERRRAELHQQIRRQEGILRQDMQGIQDRWSSFTSVFSLGARFVQYIAPKSNYILLGAQLLQRLFHRRKK